ncbi:MAG: DMT family transporter [Rickettsiales bacterium]
MKTNSVNNFGIILLIIAGCFFGFGPIFVKYSNVTTPFAVTFYRVLIAAIIILIYSIITNKSIKIPLKLHLKILYTAFFLALDFGMFYLAMNYTTLSNVSLINNLSPIFVNLIMWIAFGIKPTKKIIIGTIMAILGLLVITGFDDNGTALGNYIALSSACLYAIYMVLITPIAKELTPVQTNLYLSGYCAFFCAIFMFLYSGEIFIPNLEEFKFLTINSIVCQVLAQTLVMLALKQVSTNIASAILLIEPVAVMILSFIIFGATLSILQIGGAALVLLGILILKK